MQTTLAEATSTAANISAGTVISTVNKGANDTLKTTWSHDLFGA